MHTCTHARMHACTHANPCKRWGAVECICRRQISCPQTSSAINHQGKDAGTPPTQGLRIHRHKLLSPPNLCKPRPRIYVVHRILIHLLSPRNREVSFRWEVCTYISMMVLILISYASVSFDSSTEKPMVSKEQKILQLNILFFHCYSIVLVI